MAEQVTYSKIVKGLIFVILWFFIPGRLFSDSYVITENIKTQNMELVTIDYCFDLVGITLPYIKERLNGFDEEETTPIGHQYTKHQDDYSLIAFTNYLEQISKIELILVSAEAENILFFPDDTKNNSFSTFSGAEEIKHILQKMNYQVRTYKANTDYYILTLKLDNSITFSLYIESKSDRIREIELVFFDPVIAAIALNN